jgi:peptide/nickel transport system permease protein
VFVFFLLRIAPGDPAAIIAGDNATAERSRPIRGKLGLDRPMVEQFVVWTWQPAARRPGQVSIFSNLPVTTLIPSVMEPTIALTLSTLFVAVGWRSDRRARGVESAHAGRPAGHGLCRAGLCRAGVRHRLRADLPVRDGSSWLPVQGYRRSPRGSGPLPQPDPALGGAGHHLHGADRAHHPRLDAGRAGEDYIRTANSKGCRPTACC